MNPDITALSQRTGFTFFDYQAEFLEKIFSMPKPMRACLYYRTGAGKSLTALAAMVLLGYDSVVVVCPPSTHRQWMDLGSLLNIKVGPMSHARFRGTQTKLSRQTPIIADEFHMFGGQRGAGWRKLDKLARHLEAPLLLLSATPNYNDVERCYCVQHTLDPASIQGGYLQFLYQHCVTEQNPFSMTPNVLGFRNYPDAAAYLTALPYVYHLPDNQRFSIEDVPYPGGVPAEMRDYGYDRRNHKMVGSTIERFHVVRYQNLVGENGLLLLDHRDYIMDLLKQANGAVMIFAVHSTVIDAASRTLAAAGVDHTVVTGSTSTQQKDTILQEFLAGTHKVLLGTATLATGTDGMDRVCNTLLILDDTDDDALRRQLIGRILPRGDYVSVASKRIIRLTPLP
jgi:hypothetical protein